MAYCFAGLDHPFVSCCLACLSTTAPIAYHSTRSCDHSSDYQISGSHLPTLQPDVNMMVRASDLLAMRSTLRNTLNHQNLDY